MTSLSGLARLAISVGLVAAGAAVVVGLADGVLLVLGGDHAATDFRPYYAAAEAVLRGDSPYPAPTVAAVTDGAVYIYPPLTALLVFPLTLLPLSVAEGLVVLCGALVVVAALLLLDVRDWRCYVVSFLWVAVLNAVGLGNLTIFLVLGAALAWRFRDRDLVVAGALGVSLAAKLFLWPLVVWLGATGRLRAVLMTTAIWLGLLTVSWAAIGFAGFVDYLDMLRIAHALWADDAYSVYALALEAGVPDRLAGLFGLFVSVALLAASFMRGKAGNDRAAFILAIAAALAFSPIVWRHYFALLLVVVAVARPRLGVVWFVPILMWPVSQGIGNGTGFETSATLAVAAVTIGLALWSVREVPDRARVGVPVEMAARPS